MLNTIKKLTELNYGSKWENFGKSRFYINKWPELIDMQVSYYNTGNISSCYLLEEKISNSKAGNWVEFGKVFIDLKTNEIKITGLPSEIIELITSALSKLEEEKEEEAAVYRKALIREAKTALKNNARYTAKYLDKKSWDKSIVARVVLLAKDLADITTEVDALYNPNDDEICDIYCQLENELRRITNVLDCRR